MWFAFPLASYFMYLLLRVGVIAFLASYLNDQNWLSDTIIPPQRFLLFQRIGFLCVVYPYCHSLSLCPAPFQSFCCLHTGFFLHLELLAEMSALQANEKEADRAELSPCFPRSVLAFLWKFGLGTNFLEFGGTPGFLKHPPQPRTQGDVGRSGEIPQNHLPFDLPLTFAWLPAAPCGEEGAMLLFLNEK